MDITPSMGSTGTALDNAIAESFVSTSKAELISELKFPTPQAEKTAIFDYLETFYNTRRLHSALGSGGVRHGQRSSERSRSGVRGVVY